VHGLTKALVLLAALASIFLAALTMAFQVNAQTLSSELISVRAQKEAIESTANASTSQYQAADNEWQRKLEQVQTANTQLTNESRTLRATVEKSRNDVLAAQQEAEQAKNRIGQISGAVQTQAELISRLEQEVTRLRQGELAWKQNEIAYADRIADLDSQLEVLNQANRALEEQIAQIRREIEGVGAGGTPGARGVVVPTVGRVLSTDKDRATGATLVRIDLGTNDGIFKDQKVYVSRGRNQFIGNLVIIQTDLQWSVGRFDDLGQGGQPRTDDIVFTSFR
jgi:outer membrane murein-binding lipoprotein Lpp